MSAATIEAIVFEVALIALMAILSAAESALRAVRRPEVLEKLSGAGARGRRLGSLSERASRYLAAVAIADFFTTFALAAVAAAYLAPGISEVLGFLGDLASGISAVVITVALVSVLALVFGLLLPRAIAARHPVTVLYFLGVPIQALSVIFGPIVAILFALTRTLGRPFGASPEHDALVTQEDLKALVERGEQQGAVEQEQRRMIHSIFEISDREAHEVMQPRMDIVGVDASVSIREALDVVVRSGHSRLPVFQETMDDVIGILYAKDLFRLVARGRFEVPLKDVLRPVHFVPETKKVDDLLREMQQQKVHMAIVVDEYGGTSGLVTIEDLIEEIVGEIRDEFEVDEQRVVLISENEAVMDARVPFEDVNELYEIEVEPSEDYDTLGGFISHELGRLPRVGDTVRQGNILFTVESMQGSRANKVRVKRETPEPAAEPRA